MSRVSGTCDRDVDVFLAYCLSEGPWSSFVVDTVYSLACINPPCLKMAEGYCHGQFEDLE